MVRIEGVEAGRQVLVQEVRLRETEREFLGPAADRRCQANILGAPKQVALSQADGADRAIGRREAATDGQLARRPFPHINRDDRLVRHRAELLRHLDPLEETRDSGFAPRSGAAARC